MSKVRLDIEGKDSASAAIDSTRGRLAMLRKDLGQLTPELAGWSANLGALLSPAGILSGAAALAVGVGKLTKSLADESEMLKNVADESGSTARQQFILRQALSEHGLAADQASVALSYLNRQIAAGNPLLRALGITTRDSYEAMQQIGDAFARSSDNATKSLIAQQLLGRSNRELVAILPTLRSELEDVAGSMRSAGEASFDQAQKAGEAADRVLDRFSRKWTDMARTVKVGAANVFLALFDYETIVQDKYMRDVNRMYPFASPGNFGPWASGPTPEEDLQRKLREAEKLKQAEEERAAATERAAKAAREEADAKERALRLGSIAAQNALGGIQVARRGQPDYNRPGLGIRVGDPFPGIKMDYDRLLEMARENQTALGRFGQEAGEVFVGGFGAAFSAVLVHGESFSASFRGLLLSLGDFVAQEVGRMLAKLALVHGLNFVGSFFGNPFLGSLVGGTTAARQSATRDALGPSVAGAGSGPSVAVYVSAFDTKDARQQLAGIGGALRGAVAAQTRLVRLGAG